MNFPWIVAIFSTRQHDLFSLRLLLIIGWGVCLSAAMGSPVAAVTLDTPIDFSNDSTGNASTEGWTTGSGGAEADAGQGGVGDHALRYQSGNNFHFFTASNALVLGDYTTAGVVELQFDARHSGATDSVELRAYLFSSFPNPGGPHARSTSALSIPLSATSWTTYTIPLLASDLVGFNGTAADVLADVTQIRFRHDPNGVMAGIQAPLPSGASIFFDNITLRAASAGNGDFDNSGIVDGLDFLAWQTGMSPNPLSAGDLALWESQYGGPPPLAANTIAVPEPAGGTLLALALAVMLKRRGRTS